MATTSGSRSTIAGVRKEAGLVDDVDGHVAGAGGGEDRLVRYIVRGGEDRHDTVEMGGLEAPADPRDGAVRHQPVEGVVEGVGDELDRRGGALEQADLVEDRLAAADGQHALAFKVEEQGEIAHDASQPVLPRRSASPSSAVW